MIDAPIYRIDQAAEDVGRIRRRLRGDEYGLHLVDRLAGHLETLDCVVHCSAAELVSLGNPVDVALELVDARARHLQRLLGSEPR